MYKLYQTAIANTAAFIRSKENKHNVEHNPEQAINAFTASSVLAIAFGKTKEDVIMDLMNVKL